MILQQVRSRLVICCFIVLLSAIIAGYISVVSDSTSDVYAYNNNNLIRFHVLANSNHPADQDLKLKVRDVILAETYELFSPVNEKDQAKDIIMANLDLIYNTAITAIRNEGFDYNVKLDIGTFTFPERDYGLLHLPEGRYEALRIVIGEGKGDNWWCVLFPPLCFVDVVQTQTEDSFIALAPDLEEGEIEVRFRFWERIRNSKAGHKLEEWWLAGLEMANSLTLPLLKSK